MAIINPDRIKSVITMPHIDYYKMMILSFNNYCLHEKESIRLYSENDLTFTKEKSDSQTIKKMSKYDLIIYSALSLEAFINFYGVFRKIKIATEFDLKLGTLNKWKIYPLQSINKGLDKNSIDFLNNIFALRNRLVHRNVKEEKPFEINKNKIFIPKNGIKLINKVNYIYRNIDELDSGFDFAGFLIPDIDNGEEWEKNVML